MTPGRGKFWAYAVGLALLYTSAYYLPYADAQHHYWLPDSGREILYPSLIGTLLLIPLGWYVQVNYLRFGFRHAGALVGMVVLELDVIISALSAVGYSAAGLAIKAWTGSGQSGSSSRWLVIVAVAGTGLIVVALAVLVKHRLSLVRLLSNLGYVYAVVAVVRIAFPSQDTYSTLHILPQPSTLSPVSTIDAQRPREVVWIIFDELDYGQTLGSKDEVRRALVPHLSELTRLGVSASNAYSPARDTVVSLPSLLMGQFPAGFRIDSSGLSLHLTTGGFEPFDQAHTVFAELPGGPSAGALLGYYHPYCTVLPAVNPCVAMPMENVGRWFDALLPASERIAATLRHLPGSAAIPGEVFHLLHPMYRITEQTVRDYPSLLRLTGHSLIFMHVNLPHYPAEFAQRTLHLRNVTSFRDGYDGNLVLVDSLVDTAMRTLREVAKTREVLLIVSSDHWHRADSPMTVQTIPWITWHVGETDAPSIVQKINTVHTAELVLDFLAGHVSSQTDIPTWWSQKSFRLPLMPDQYDD